MTVNKQKMGSRTAIAVVLGLVVGAAAGQAVGVYVVSDNLPFFIALGSAICATIGLLAGLALALRPGS